jgi:hypothetical protein
MPNFVINDFSGWIAQENFHWSQGQVAYLENINIDERKYMKLEQAFSSPTAIWSFNETINQMVETPNGVIQIWPTKTFLTGWDASATVAGWQRVEFFSDWTSGQYNIIFQSANIYKTNATISSTTNVVHWVSATTTASCIDWNDVLFAKANVIYRVDVSLATPWTPTVEIDTIPSGSVIVYMYMYNDVLMVVTRKYQDTIIWTCTINSTTGKFALYQQDPNIGIRVLWAIWDSGSIYWVSSNTIYQFSWVKSQPLRKFWYTSSLVERTISAPKLHFSNNTLYVADTDVIYRFWSRTPWRNWYMRTSSFTDTIQAITENYVHALNGTANRLYAYANGYRSTWFDISLPYDWGEFGLDKSNLAFRASYQLPIWTYTGTQCSIVIWVMTDYMEQVNVITYVTVATITDSTTRSQTITVQEINSALTTAWYSSDWNYIRFKITENWGNELSSIMQKTPKFYGIRAIHNITNDALKG